MSSSIAPSMVSGGTFPVSFACAVRGGVVNVDSVSRVEGSLWRYIDECLRSDSIGCVSVSMAVGGW